MSVRVRSQIIPRNASIIFTNEQEWQTEEERVKQALFREEIFMLYSEREEICQLFVDQFFEFLEKHKDIEEPENVDLSVVSFEELKIIIATFKKKNGLNPKKVEPLPVIPEELTQSTSKSKAASTIFEEFFDIVHEKVPYKNGAWDYEFKMKQLQCKRKQFFYNNLIRTSVMVKSPTVRRRATYFFFETKTLWIKVSSTYKNSTREVFRTIDDFIFLHDTLEKIYPHSFLPELNITMQEIKNIDSQPNNLQITKKCASFVNFIMRDDELFDNQFTFRFFTEEIQPKYAQHKVKNESIFVDTIQEFVNSTGTMQVNVSKEGEQAKRCIAAISELFQEKFAQIGNVTKYICEHAQPLPKFVDLFSTLINEIIAIANSHEANSYFNLAHFINLLNSYKKMGEITRESLHSCKSVLSNIRQSFLVKTFATWSQFNIYRQNMMHYSSIYQEKRKIFLQSLSRELNQPINVLDLTSNEQECSWIQNETAWYGHLNSSLIKTFSILLKQEEEALHKALKEALGVLNERHERQKKNLDFISRLISQT